MRPSRETSSISSREVAEDSVEVGRNDRLSVWHWVLRWCKRQPIGLVQGLGRYHAQS